MPGITPREFAAKWSGSKRTERAASQEHFIDLCRMLDVQTPNEADPIGDWYAFEKDAEKSGGTQLEPNESTIRIEGATGVVLEILPLVRAVDERQAQPLVHQEVHSRLEE